MTGVQTCALPISERYKALVAIKGVSQQDYDDAEAAAKQNPDVSFAIVDNASFEGVDNAKGLIFNAAQPAFMAGYAAAAMTSTGTVGTFGGANYPTVSIFMDGFAQGVQYFNEKKGKSVQVLGWDAAKQDGQFRAFWKSFDESVNLMASGEVVIQSMWSPAVAAVRAKGIACKYQPLKEGYRSWGGGLGLASHLKGAQLDADGQAALQL